MHQPPTARLRPIANAVCPAPPPNHAPCNEISKLRRPATDGIRNFNLGHWLQFLVMFSRIVLLLSAIAALSRVSRATALAELDNGDDYGVLVADRQLQLAQQFKQLQRQQQQKHELQQQREQEDEAEDEGKEKEFEPFDLANLRRLHLKYRTGQGATAASGRQQQSPQQQQQEQEWLKEQLLQQHGLLQQQWLQQQGFLQQLQPQKQISFYGNNNEQRDQDNDNDNYNSMSHGSNNNNKYNDDNNNNANNNNDDNDNNHYYRYRISNSNYNNNHNNNIAANGNGNPSWDDDDDDADETERAWPTRARAKAGTKVDGQREDDDDDYEHQDARNGFRLQLSASNEPVTSSDGDVGNNNNNNGYLTPTTTMMHNKSNKDDRNEDDAERDSELSFGEMQFFDDLEMRLPYGIQNVKRVPRRNLEHGGKITTYQSLCPTKRVSVPLETNAYEYRPNHYIEVTCAHSYAPTLSLAADYNKNRICSEAGFACIQLNRTIHLIRRNKASSVDCWESEIRVVPSGCECMWPKHHYGDIITYHQEQKRNNQGQIMSQIRAQGQAQSRSPGRTSSAFRPLGELGHAESGDYLEIPVELDVGGQLRDAYQTY